MKKIFRLFSVLAASVALLASCGQLIEMPKDVQGGDIPAPEPIPSDGKVVFNATHNDLASWEKGASISIFDGSSVLASSNTEEDGILAKFPVKVAEGASSFLAAYPAVQSMTLTSAQYQVPVQQAAVAGVADKAALSYIAKSTDNRLYFVPLTATLSVTVAMDDAAELVFTPKNAAKVSGAFTADYTQDCPVVAAAENASASVSLKGAFVKGQTYGIVVIPALIEGYTIVVKDAQGKEIAHNSSNVEMSVEAGDFAALGEVYADADLPQVFQVSHVWLWGGTGPEWDCTKVWDMYAKAGLFDSTDGRGINAMKDDYLELHKDGTFKNWAGADERHWWMAYDKSQTPSKYKSLDIAKFYGLFPKNSGSYVMDGANLTFTKEDGSTTSGVIVGPGTYEMPGTKPVKTITITTMAVMFEIKGGVDDWDHSWDDYGVFYRHPRVVFFELEQMPAGFITPEESMTTDDVVFVEPEDPKPDADLSKLPGSYQVVEIKVNGGSGDDPAFVGVLDKSWDWDDTIWNLQDDRLEVTATDLNYWNGPDGKWWNYKWKGGDPDLTPQFSVLPKGKHSYTINPSTLEFTIDGGSKPGKLLLPGVHHFDSGNRDLTVEEGQIALAFHWMDMIGATSERWTDIDRFVNAPIDIVYVFKKL